ncbi:MAG: asparagine synthase-related protein [Gemmatimonadota bacterium]
MSSFVVQLHGGGTHDVSHVDDVAFRVSTGRLSSRRPGQVRSGGIGFRWAAIATDGELSDGVDRFIVRDTSPFMVEPPTGQQPVVSVTVEDHGARAVLTRDRFGAKPLFYVAHRGGWLIASEAKCLTPFLNGVSVDRDALAELVRYHWMPGSGYLDEQITQVLPGATVWLVPGQPARSTPLETITFDVARRDAHNESFEWFCDRTDEAFRSTIRRACKGAGEAAVLLSGGIDSSLLAALAKAEGIPLRAYVLRYEGYVNPEYDRAIAVSKMLDLPVEEVTVPRNALSTMVPYMVWREERTPRHANTVALRILLDACAQRSSVVIHGDGAEAIFGLKDVHRVGQFERRRRIAMALTGGRKRPRLAKVFAAMPSERARRIAKVLTNDAAEFYRQSRLIEYSPRALALLEPLYSGAELGEDIRELLPSTDALNSDAIHAYQCATFLQGSLLRIDRHASPLGLSVCLPFCSSEGLAVASVLPFRHKLRNGKGKPILRALCGRYLPAEVLAWPKIGFGAPHERWIMDSMSPRWVPELFRGAEPSRLARLLPDANLRTLIALDDHEAHWFAITLELALRQLEDTRSMGPGVAS